LSITELNAALVKMLAFKCVAKLAKRFIYLTKIK
jgi:hypothetical protein